MEGADRRCLQQGTGAGADWSGRMKEKSPSIRECVICHQVFMGYNSQKVCDSPSCKAEYRKNRNATLYQQHLARRAKNKITPPAKPVAPRDMPEPMTPETMSTDGVINLVNKLFESARMENDTSFFNSELARFIYDSAGADIEDVVKTI